MIYKGLGNYSIDPLKYNKCRNLDNTCSSFNTLGRIWGFGLFSVLPNARNILETIIIKATLEAVIMLLQHFEKRSYKAA